MNVFHKDSARDKVTKPLPQVAGAQPRHDGDHRRRHRRRSLGRQRSDQRVAAPSGAVMRLTTDRGLRRRLRPRCPSRKGPL